MRSYKVLNKQIHTIGNYKISPIRNEDRYDIMKWRNEQIYHLRQISELTKTDQDRYFNNIIASLFKVNFPNQILFSFFLNDDLIGYGGLVHINWAHGSAEISFLMNTSEESFHFKEHWNNFLYLIENIAFMELKFKKIFVFAYDVRKHLYPVLIDNSYVLTDRKLNYYTYNNNIYDALIFTKFNKL